MSFHALHLFHLFLSCLSWIRVSQGGDIFRYKNGWCEAVRLRNCGSSNGEFDDNFIIVNQRSKCCNFIIYFSSLLNSGLNSSLVLLSICVYFNGLQFVFSFKIYIGKYCRQNKSYVVLQFIRVIRFCRIYIPLQFELSLAHFLLFIFHLLILTSSYKLLYFLCMQMRSSISTII